MNLDKVKLICKKRHNGFIEERLYEGILFHNAIMITNKNIWGGGNKHIYGLKRSPGVDFIEDWFWTLGEWRERQLNKIID